MSQGRGKATADNVPEGRGRQGQESDLSVQRENLADCIHGLSPRTGNEQKRGRREGKGGSRVRGKEAAENKSKKADEL